MSNNILELRIVTGARKTLPACFNHIGDEVAVCCDNVVNFFSVATGKKIRSLENNTNLVQSLQLTNAFNLSGMPY